MNNKDKMELAKWTVAQAKKAGADEAAVDLGNSRQVEIEYRDGQIDKLQESTQNGIDLRVYVNSRYSSNSTNDLRRESLAKFAEEAVAMTKYLGEDPYRTLPDPKYYKAMESMDLGTCDKDHGAVTSDQRVQLAREIEENASSVSDKILYCNASYNDGIYESVKVHSNGFEGSRRSTVFSAGVEVGVTDGKGGRPSSWDWKTVRHFKDLPAAPTYGQLAVARAIARIGGEKIQSGSYEVIVENRARTSLLGAMQGPLSGRNLQQKNSCLEGKLGQKVFSELLTVTDDPYIKGALGSRQYDGDGLPCRKRIIIDKGVIKEYLIDWYYSRKLGVEPTGGSPCNVTFALGNRSLEEMIADTEKGILINGFIGGNSNPTTGDFSYGIFGSVIEDGKLTQPISEMNISGNILEFWNNLVEVGNDPYQYSSIQRPTMRFTNVSLSGM
jgi:PmbA protein